MTNAGYKWEALWESLTENKILSVLLMFLLMLCIWSFVKGHDQLVPRLGAVLVSIGVIWEVKVVGQVLLAREKSIIQTTLNSANILSEQFVLHNKNHECYSRPSAENLAASVTSHAERYGRELSFVILVGTTVIIFGTLLWAFGDWLTCAFVHCSSLVGEL